MGTRAMVGMQIGKNKYLSVYTHWDGYPSHHLNILCHHYNTKEKVAELLSHGDISSLNVRCDGADGLNRRDANGLITKHTFDTPVKDQTVYYGRDRGEHNVGAKTHKSLTRFNQEEYGYLFKDGQWWTVQGETLTPADAYLKNGEFQDEVNVIEGDCVRITTSEKTLEDRVMLGLDKFVDKSNK